MNYLPVLLFVTTISGCDNFPEITELGVPEDFPGLQGSSAVLTPGSFGSLMVNMTAAESGLRPESQVPGTTCAYDVLDVVSGRVLVMFHEGTLARFDVADKSQQRLENNLKIGSTVDDLRAAYPEKLKATPNNYDGRITNYEVSFGNNLHGVFRVRDGSVENYSLGRAPEVFWVEGCA